MKSAMLSVALAALTATSALAADPYDLGCGYLSLTRDATVTPVGVTVGKYLYMMNPFGLWNAGFIGRIDRENPELSEFAVTFSTNGAGSPARDKLAIGTWVAVGSTIRSLAVPKDEDIRTPDILFARERHRNRADAMATYNGMQLMAVETWSLDGSWLLGTQVMDRTARRLIADALMNGTPFELGARTVGDPYGNFAYHWVKDGLLCKFGWERLITRVVPAADPSIDLQPISGKFDVSNGKVVVSAPPQCDNAGTSVACPVTAKVGTLQTDFRFDIPAELRGKVWFQSSAGARLDTLPAVSLPNSKLVMSGDYLDSLLGTQEEVDIDNLVKVNLIIKGVSGLTLPVSFVEKSRLKRLTYGVSISERNPAAIGHYSGSIGQDPDITIPLEVRQFGASRATKIVVKVNADEVALPSGPRCKFVGNGGTTVVGVPANVRFYNGTSLDDFSDNCTGREYDVTNMTWTPRYGGGFIYEAALDMDLIFPLSPNELRLDASGNAWLGTVEAKGDVTVKAWWD